MNGYVIETMLPDGPHWYAGIRTQVKDGVTIQGPEWSPYWEDRKRFNFAQAEITFNTVCQSIAGAKIIDIDKALRKDAWRMVDEIKGHYSIRAKYLSVGMIVIISGYISKMEVLKKTGKRIILLPHTGVGNQTEIGSNSNTWVTVVGKKKREGAK
jgi:hypothetical protein